MGKPKKGSKNRQEEDLEDDVAAEINALSLGGDDEDDDDDVRNTKQQKPSAVSAFSMLAIEEPESNEESDEDVDEKPAKTQSKPKSAENDNEPPVSKNANKKKGKKEKNKKQEDDDLDAILAEIDKPVEKGKKKKKKKGGDVDDEGVDKETAGQEANDNDVVEEKMDNIKVITAEDLYPDSDEDKKNKKKKGKKGKEENKTEEPVDGEKEETETVAEVKIMTAEDLYPDSDEDKKKKKKKGKKGKEEAKTEETVEGDVKGQDEVKGDDEEEEGGPTMKTAAQKKKEKKDREKKARQEKASKKPKGETEEAPESKEGSAEPAVATTTDEPQESAAATTAEGAEGASDDDGEGEKKSKKDKKKKKKDKTEKTEKEKKKKPPSAQIKAMQEAVQKMKEEEEQHKRAEEERIAHEEEEEKLREEKKRLEDERKEKKKQKEKERKERLRKEGRLLTEKQKQDQKRAQQMLELMEAQGIKVPQRDQAEEPKKKRVVYGRQRKKKTDTEEQTSGDLTQEAGSPEEERSPSIEVELQPEKETETLAEEPEAKDEELPAAWDGGDDDEVKDDWDASEGEEEASQVTDTAKAKDEPPTKVVKVEDKKEEEKEEEEDEEDEDEDDESEEESDDDDESSSEEEDEDLTPVEKARAAVEKRKLEAEKKKDPNILRAPVVCVLGHVDTGKTKILDKLRRTNVQDGEAGGITQQIGATNVPLDAIKNQTRMCKDFQKFDLKLPGLLIIDTPGHESFSNLRSRGSSLCDIAILVIDIMHGLEPQTIESIELLKSRKTPFIVALNKIDRLFGWKPDPHKDVKNVIAKQAANCKMEFEERTTEVITQLSEQGLNGALYYENKNVREYVSLVPTSAHSGDGMGSLMALVCELTQTMLAKRLTYVETLEATVMEVKALPGLGTTVDVILVNGALRESDIIVVPGTEGPIVTQVRGLLMPQPMKELRVKNAYEKHKEVRAAQGVKLIAKDLEKALAGLPMYVAANQDEVEYYKEELAQSLKEALSCIKLTSSGVYVQASTLGSLEALLEFLRTSKIPYAGINIGPVHKKDVMKASVMLEHESQYAVILAFDVKVEREAQEMADSLGVIVFTADIIYHLFDQFTKYRDDLQARKKEEFKHIAVFPCKLRILPNCIFNSRDPIVVGVSIEAGVIKEGTPLCVPTKEFIEVGRISSIEANHKQVNIARKGMEVCIKIENTSGDAPKLYGRHFDHTDLLVSQVSRTSINALKDYFRDEMTKADWAVVLELKKIFDII